MWKRTFECAINNGCSRKVWCRFLHARLGRVYWKSHGMCFRTWRLQRDKNRESDGRNALVVVEGPSEESRLEL